ncbi:uncharacterized protein LOC136089366 isoform X1 [Hydra vulgaris]|uniref:Uncharacterized protein LOC136089366 isoform X1 n=1 Tax=Hydra vulgaris TaxID=6087 RepID=A0ABM4DAL7_HYDVU
MQSMDEAKIATASDLPVIPGLMTALVILFDEKLHSLFMLMDKTTAMSEVPCGQLLTPHLCVFGDALLTAKLFALLVDGIVIVENISNFTKAFCCLFTAYYVFNIPYPNQVSTTLEFYQC